MSVHIELSRPLTLFLILGGVVWVFTSATSDTSLTGQLLPSEQTMVEGMGGNEPPQIAIRTAEDEVRRARLESELLTRKLEILKYQVKRIDEERKVMGSDLTPAESEEFRATLRSLVELMEDQSAAESKLLKTFREMWEARQDIEAAAALGRANPAIRMIWPIQPVYGISALFHDPEYEQLFGLVHNAIDIPALQSTEILAAEGGTVERVADNGLGYSYLTLRHDGYATVYGHVSQFLVAEGDTVVKGQPVALSGGLPGTKGAGHLSTGPHLHFEVVTGEGPVNPLEHLPAAGVKLR